MTELEMMGVAYLLAFVVGLVVSGIVSSIWAIVAEEPPELAMLGQTDLLTPVRVLVVVLCAPTMLFSGAFGWMMERSPLALGYVALGFVWSFFQGVFILTSLFSVT
jgi:hypothetical protein